MFTLQEKLRQLISGLTLWLSKLGSALAWPFKRTSRAIVWLFFEGTDSFQDLMSALARAISRPFWAAGRGLLRLWRRVSSPWSRLADSPTVNTVRRLLLRAGLGLLSVGEVFHLDRPIRAMIWLLQPVWRPVVSIVRFCFAWASTRNYRQLLWGLPALLVLLLPTLFVLAQTIAFGNGSVTENYRVAVKRALEAKEYDQVRFYERKLAQLGVDTNLTDFRTAETLAQDGRLDEAYERMQRLAPTDEPGYPAAHFWILSQLLGGKLNVPRDESLRLAGIHLELLKSLGLDGPGVQRMGIYWQIQTNQLAAAAMELKPLAILDGDFATQRMKINLALQQRGEALKDARLVQLHMQERKRKSSRLTSEEYESWAIAASLLQNQASLKSILLEWLEFEPENARPRESLAKLNRLQFDKLLHASQPSARVLGDMLIDASRTTHDPTMLDQLVQDIVAGRLQRPVFRRLAEYLVQAPETPVLICEKLGSAAASTNELELAKLLLERTIELDEGRLIAWNNYAWVLANGDAHDLDQALEAANRALEIARDSPAELRVRETRGQILASLGRWPEAIADLRYAVNGMPGNKEIHRTLAKAYTAQEDRELAQMHHDLSK